MSRGVGTGRLATLVAAHAARLVCDRDHGPVDRAGLERLLSERGQDREAIRRLVGAVSDYGERLRTHTQAVQDMARAAHEIANAAAQIQAALGTTVSEPRRAGPDRSTTFH